MAFTLVIQHLNKIALDPAHYTAPRTDSELFTELNEAMRYQTEIMKS